jgi:CDP-diacylglycerol---glycerol-3-phosphate 3-phosphatidyltransferase
VSVTPAAQPSPSQQDAYLRQIPNALTLARLVIAAAFFLLLAVWNYPGRHIIDEAKIGPLRPLWPYLVAAALFGLAALTDAIDGPLARRWGAVSRLGRVLDPFADKVLVIGAFIMLAGPTFGVDVEGKPTMQVSGVTSWMVVIILGRELLVTSIRAVLEADGKDFSATWSGKAKMILQACVIPFILVMLGITDVRPGSLGRWLVDIAVWVTVAVTVVSGIPYVRRGMALMR